MRSIRQEACLWIAALTLGGAAIFGAAVLDGQMVVTQGNTGALQMGGSDKPLDPGNGLIVGRALDAATSRPVPGAIVTLISSGFAPVRVMADAQGQFAFTNLPPGKFNLSATKPGYVDGAYGRMRPAGSTQSIDLTADQRVGDAAISLWKFAAISGRVSDEAGDPVVNANVRVLKRSIVAGRRQLVVGSSDTTDDRGIYRICSLEPGEYVVVVPMTQGSSRDSLLQIAGLPRDLLAALPAGGGGAGGAAMAFTARVETTGGGPPVVIESSDTGVPPAGTTPDGHSLTYQTEFYPSSLTASRATPVTVGAGEERTGIDFQLKPVRTVTLSGAVNSPDGQPSGLQLSLVPAEADDLLTPIETATTTTDGSGRFQFVNVPPGQYALRALRSLRTAPGPGATTVVMQGGGGMTMTSVMTRVTDNANAPTPPLPTAPALWADLNVLVGANDVTDVVVPLRQGLRVAGRVEFNGSAAPPTGDQLSSIGISLEPADGRTAGMAGTVRGRVESSGSFQTMGVPVGKYVLRVTAPRGWTLRGASFNGQDIVDTAVELRDGDASGVVVTFIDRPGDLSGTVTAANGNPDATASAIAFPTDRAMWVGAGTSPRRLKNVRTGKNGSYSFGVLPMGDYFVVAVPDAAAGDWQNPDFLDTLSRSATRVRVDEGEKKTQPLQTMRMR